MEINKVVNLKGRELNDIKNYHMQKDQILKLLASFYVMEFQKKK